MWNRTGIKRFVEEELKLPYLRIETDYGPSDSAQDGVRVEALFETVPRTLLAVCRER